MAKEIIEETGREIATVQDANSGNVLAMVLQAARDPEIDADKMKTLAELAMRIRDDERETQFNRDLNAAKKEMPSIARDGAVKNKAGGIQSRFSSWERLNPIVSDILVAHNLTIGHEIGHTAKGDISVIPVLTHDNGMIRRGTEMVFPPDTSGNKSAAQAVVSSASYGQRVTTIKLLNIRTHDAPDQDGNTGTPEDHMSPAQRQLIDDGRAAAMNGSDAYGEWFKELPAAEKGWLVFEGVHGRNKEAAAQVDNP